MYQPATRLLTILEILQARPQTTAAELSRRLEVDVRTVRRYVTMLQDMGIPVRAAHGRYGGYRLRPGYKLPPLMLSEEEALAVTLGLIVARRLGLSTAAPATEGAIAKIERVLPFPVAERLRALQETIGFTQPPRRSTPAAPDLLLDLGAAVRAGQRLRLRYAGRGGRPSERELDPYGVVFHQGRWYLVGLDHRVGGMRTFRVDRVLAVEPRDQRFERPEGFDAVGYLTGALADRPWGTEVEVLFETTLARARRQIPAHVANLEEVPGGVVMRTQSDDLAAGARAIVGLGLGLNCRFRVLRPDALGEEVRKLLRALAALAER